MSDDIKSNSSALRLVDDDVVVVVAEVFIVNVGVVLDVVVGVVDDDVVWLSSVVFVFLKLMGICRFRVAP